MSAASTVQHEPVMVAQTLEGLAVRPGGRYIDATRRARRPRRGGARSGAARRLAAGHRRGSAGAGGCRRPAGALRQRRAAGARPLPRRGGDRRRSRDSRRVEGVLFDLGVSSLQLDAPGRGFSFQRDEPLDMRMDPDAELTAAVIVNEYGEGELAELLRRFGEEPRSRAIARAIVAARPLHTTGELAGAVARVAGRGRERRTINPATLTFQALRIAVNRELDFLADALTAACGLLDGRRRSPGGDLLSLARRPHRQGLPPPGVARLPLPAAQPRLRLRPHGDPATGHPARTQALRRRGRSQSPRPFGAAACRRGAGRTGGGLMAALVSAPRRGGSPPPRRASGRPPSPRPLPHGGEAHPIVTQERLARGGKGAPPQAAQQRPRTAVARRLPPARRRTVARTRGAGVGALQVLQSTRTAEAGYELRSLQAERADLGARLRLLEAEIAHLADLDAVLHRRDHAAGHGSRRPHVERGRRRARALGHPDARTLRPADRAAPHGDRAVVGAAAWDRDRPQLNRPN